MESKSNEDKFKEIPALVSKDCELLRVENINYKPHPYCIGSAHVVFASDHFGGMLGRPAIEHAERKGIKCGMKGCHVKFEDHTSDTVVLVKIRKDVADRKCKLTDLDGVKVWWENAESVCKKLGIDGFAFVKGD